MWAADKQRKITLLVKEKLEVIKSLFVSHGLYWRKEAVKRNWFRLLLGFRERKPNLWSQLSETQLLQDTLSLLDLIVSNHIHLQGTPLFNDCIYVRKTKGDWPGALSDF